MTTPLTKKDSSQPQPSKARKEQAPRAEGSPASGERSETANVHIERYFPKGYDPDAEPWKSIKSHHYASLAATQAPRGQQQEWTPEFIGNQTYGVWVVNTGKERISCGNEYNAKDLSHAHNAELVAERQRREQELHQLAIYLEGNCYSDPDFMPDSRALKAAVTLRGKLLPALAAIENVLSATRKGSRPDLLPRAFVHEVLGKVDLPALYEHDAEVREPLVKALEELRPILYALGGEHLGIIDDALALAKVKDQ